MHLSIIVTDVYFPMFGYLLPGSRVPASPQGDVTLERILKIEDGFSGSHVTTLLIPG